MKVLLIQTAFIGDVILMTSAIESIASSGVKVDVVVRKGNENILENNPHVNRLFVFDKKHKLGEFKRFKKTFQKDTFDYVMNFQRFASSGVLGLLVKAKERRCYKQNPLSKFYTRTYIHEMNSGRHEIERNFDLIKDLVSIEEPLKPRIYPKQLVIPYPGEYVCVAPASVWFTKQYPENSWKVLVEEIAKKYHVVFLGGPSDKELCEHISVDLPESNYTIEAGKRSLMESAYIIRQATRTLVNDSGPLHLASAMNAPVTAFFCSTVPSFGFGPLSDDSMVLEYSERLECRPCGKHGYKACPEGHFTCSKIETLPLFMKLGC